MYILGFNCYAHNAAACLLEDGRPIASAAEERFNRKKIYGDFPIQAIRYCLSAAGIGIEDVSYVGFHWDPWHRLDKRIAMVLRYLPYASFFYNSHAQKWIDILKAPREFKKRVPATRGKAAYSFIRVKHHLSHGASSFLVSPYSEAAILTLDGTGEMASTTLARGSGNQIEILKEILYPTSVGYLFVALTQYLGFVTECDEYKLMSLASGGEDQFYREFEQIIPLLPDGGYRVDLSYCNYHKGVRDPWVSRKFIERMGPLRKPGEPLEPRHRNIAWALQRRLEDVALHLARHLHRLTGSKNLCLAGGVALNSVMNGRLLRESPFENIFIQPAANDAGCCLGSAAYIYHCLLDRPRENVFKDAYLGPGYSADECRRALEAAGLAYRHLSEEALVRETAGLIAQGKIVGWFQGRMEMGPRALGNRSILADPRRAEMKDIINSRVKHREAFRPFAPSVLEEAAAEYFEDAIPSPYKLFVFKVRPEKRAVIPAVTHVDGTARIQTVAREQNPLYWKLIRKFEELSGLPVVLNTSFNVMGEPIVCTPVDAVRCFMSCGIDCLVLGPHLVTEK